MEQELKILNTLGEIIENPDLSLGYLEEEMHTFISPAVPAKTHNWITGIFFTDGSAYYPDEKDPNNYIEIIDAENKKFKYNNPNDTRTISGQVISTIIDEPEIPYREDIEQVLVFHPYNDLEFSHEETIDDLLLLIADLVGNDLEESYDEITEN